VDRDRRGELLRSAVKIPERTVYREFAGETVAVNTDTGQYFGLNATAARMLAALEEAGTVADALALLAELFGCPAEEIEPDFLETCARLQERGLIVLDTVDGG
jgi:Coenzyme PQQ synthesis protein D (PqqD)